MDEKERKALIGFQQAELDAVLLYQGLAELMKTEEERTLMLKIAADEGRHAGILKQYTDEKLTPNPKLGKTVAALYRVMGKKTLFALMSKFEINSAGTYEPYFEKYPAIAGIAADEIRHGHLLNDNR